MATIRAKLEPDVGAPLARALMRVEAELLLKDADAVGTSQDARRAPAQRRFDALMTLVLRVNAAG